MNNITITCTVDGLMLLLPGERGFAAKPLKAPDSWGLSGVDSSWLKGFPISLELKDVNGVWEVTLGKHGDEKTLVAFSGVKDSAESVKQALQSLWMSENGVTPQPVAAPAVTSAKEVSKSHESASSGHKKWLLPAGVSLGVVVLGVASFFAANYFINSSSQAPSLDLSNLSLEQVAEIDSNPVLMHSIKSNMMDAVKFGAEAAKDMSDELSQEHIETLKNLGLDPGISMENATACFANLYK